MSAACHSSLLWKMNKLEALIYHEGFHPQLSEMCHVHYASINSSGAHPLPGQPQGICSNVSPGGGALAARGLGISLPRGDPRAFDTRVFELTWKSLSERTRTS